MLISGFCSSAVNRSSYTKQKQLQLPHEQQKQKQLQQLQLHTTEAATVPETEATAGNNSYSYVTLQKQNTLQLHTIMRTEHPDTKTRPDTTRHNRTQTQPITHDDHAHERRKQNTIKSTEAPETSYTPPTHTDNAPETHTHTQAPGNQHRHTDKHAPRLQTRCLKGFGVLALEFRRFFRVLRF